MPTPAKPTAEQRAEWVKIKKRAWGNVAGCLAAIALIAIPSLLVKLAAYLTAYRAADARFSVALVNIDHESWSLFGATILASVFGFAMAGAIASKYRLLWPVALLTFFVLSALPAYFWYRGFVLVAVDSRGQAELRYMWPRPSVRADVLKVGSIEPVETDTPADDDAVDAHFKWFVTIEVDGKPHHSIVTNFPSSIFEAQNRLLREKYTALLRAEESAGKTSSAQFADLALELGDANFALKDFTQARDAYARALTAYESSAGPSSLPLSRAAFKLARAHMELKDFARAEPLLKRVMDIHTASKQDSDDPDVTPARAAYKNLLEQTGRPDEAAAIILPPTTLLSVYTQRYGKEEARKRIEAQLEARRRLRTGEK